MPISLSVFQGDALESMHIANSADLPTLVPGLIVSTVGPGQYTVGIRGISGSPGFTADPIGCYVDEIPVSAFDAALFEFNRVEVLRGPLRTLYGSSSMGGTIRYISASATSDIKALSFSTRASFGPMDEGGSDYEHGATANLPLGASTALQVVAIHKYTDGFIYRYAIPADNILGIDTSSAPVRDVDAYKLKEVRATLLLNPADSLTIKPSFYQKPTLKGPYTIDVQPGSAASLIQARDIAEPRFDGAARGNLMAAWDIAGDLNGVLSVSYFDREVRDTQDYSRIWAEIVVPQPVIGIEQYPTTRTRNASAEARIPWEPKRRADRGSRW